MFPLQVDGEQALNMLNLPDAMGSRSQDLPLRVSAASFRDATKKPRFFARLFGSCCGSSSKIADSGGKEGQAQSRKHLARSQAGQSLRDMSLVRSPKTILRHRSQLRARLWADSRFCLDDWILTQMRLWLSNSAL